MSKQQSAQRHATGGGRCLAAKTVTDWLPEQRSTHTPRTASDTDMQHYHQARPQFQALRATGSTFPTGDRLPASSRGQLRVLNFSESSIVRLPDSLLALEELNVSEC
jgi:hypothetical protein